MQAPSARQQSRDSRAANSGSGGSQCSSRKVQRYRKRTRQAEFISTKTGVTSLDKARDKDRWLRRGEKSGRAREARLDIFLGGFREWFEGGAEGPHNKSRDSRTGSEDAASGNSRHPRRENWRPPCSSATYQNGAKIEKGGPGLPPWHYRK